VNERSDEGRLARELGVGGATLLGLGSIVGTGVYVSIGIGAGIAGSWVLASVFIAAILATLNGLSSAQLAAAHPVSGGTYEYGYEFLSPRLGFIAGWMFISAKSASAATAALGFAGYVSDRLEVDVHVVLALAAVSGVTIVVLRGITRSNQVNAAILVVSVGVLLLLGAVSIGYRSTVPSESGPAVGFADVLNGAAIMFVAYTGYGRVATLGEEVRRPAVTIPKAIITTLGATMLLYMFVTATSLRVLGPVGLADATAETAAPLEAVARTVSLDGGDWLVSLVAVGAGVAMLGVLLNLVLGLSRVVLAMGRRRDVPAMFGRVSADGRAPVAAVVAVGAIVAGLAMIGSVRLTWTFSAFTVLVYYAITNLAAIRLPPAARRYPIWQSWLGLIGCLFLALWIDPAMIAIGSVVILFGLVWHGVAQRR
jgi:APA family basic amino acid/polyamine antiporter